MLKTSTLRDYTVPLPTELYNRIVFSRCGKIISNSHFELGTRQCYYLSSKHIDFLSLHILYNDWLIDKMSQIISDFMA